MSKKTEAAELAEVLRHQIAATIALYEKVTGDRYGSKHEAPPAPRRTRRQKYVPRDILPKVHTCPHCGETKKLDEFGTRKVRIPPSATNAGGVVLRYNSWCKKCRSSPDAHPTRLRFGR